MKLYLISQSINDLYSFYLSAVVAAESEDDARTIHPSEYPPYQKDGKWMEPSRYPGDKESEDNGFWVDYSDIDKIKVEYLGDTKKPRGLILANREACC
jgi:hypothetical protein